MHYSISCKRRPLAGFYFDERGCRRLNHGAHLRARRSFCAVRSGPLFRASSEKYHRDMRPARLGMLAAIRRHLASWNKPALP